MKWGPAVASIGIVLLVWIFVFSQVRYEERQAINAAVRTNIHRVIAFEQYVRRTLEGAELAGTFISEQYAPSLELASSTRPAVLTIDDAALRAPGLSEISVFNRAGDLIATTVAPPPQSLNVYEADFFRQHLSNNSTTLFVSHPSRSNGSEEWLLLLTRRVNLADGSMGGIVSIRILPKELTSFLQNAELNTTDLVSVINLDGITLARREGNALSFGEDLQGTLVMQMQEKNPYGTYLGPSSLDGLVRYFSHRRLPQYGIFVTSGVSADEVLGPVRSRAIGYYLGGALISLATMVAAWLTFVLGRRRKSHETEIMAANSRLRNAQQIAKLGDWRYDLQREEFVWSEDLCTMYERPSAENRLSRMDLSQLVGPHGIAAFQAALEQCRTFGGQQEFELAVRLPSGAITHRHVVAIADFGAAGEVLGMHGTDQDITPGKLLESLRQQVGLLSKLDALKAVAATIAHELSQPLTAASNYLSGSMRILTGRSDPANEILVEALTAVREQLYRAGEIIRRVRNQIGSGQPQIQLISLAAVIRSAITQFEAANPGSKVSVESKHDIETEVVLADPIQIQQILGNLFRNALEASFVAPKISVSVRRGKGGLVEVCVHDEGPGFPATELEVLSSFSTSKAGGLGIGLAISRTLIEGMGGKIWVEQTGPSGTTICFSVPKHDDRA
ncbi:ATP-binding protein [Altererythrobacter sp. KTW20L]|uniref:ATP-binding protein n=1 Tax=Altererythrobacter sp. KTW20L TaxID=2942210 RepID=UPI0020BE87F9|nr:ATP-binding protein [Altererythrobacter sp. KTW20L]MCL6252255.1 ATP-binding protein [Altererythrobacter sp. KTW20L]